MTRVQKIKRIRIYRPGLYIQIASHVPNLVHSPEKATDEEIAIYNRLIAEEAKRDNNNVTFRKNFSF